MSQQRKVATDTVLKTLRYRERDFSGGDQLTQNCVNSFGKGFLSPPPTCFPGNGDVKCVICLLFVTIATYMLFIFHVYPVKHFLTLVLKGAM